MFNHQRPRQIALSVAVVLVFLAGCGQSAVSGLVTLDGAPLEKGQISFQPVDKGRPEGGPIVGGKYTVKGLPAGKYRVSVVSMDAPPAPSSMEEGIKKPNVQADPTADASGNHETVDITGASQTLDVKLTRAKK